MTRVEKMAAVFNEWNRQYAENPTKFSKPLNDDGTPKTDYGQCAAEFFVQIEQEMVDSGALPEKTMLVDMETGLPGIPCGEA